ncbi:uncharacterized protein LOC123532534 [Mercenaria mercenaria]|uniref:uncharacterized protein LOC123532534 n=1 Tax=Mercenaria mercenaria TaxID=6596 RepID=UPI00234E5AEC|nr:uncharacterized protein LOC123532534 [Mercenaria mercenaria]XP_045169928.2 uncharacterized protein LOC123532534 [Mercenaria mercenaria]XP_053373743.1 uncharacterized protein LOC123532534 [Mercenaria mercenaria]
MMHRFLALVPCLTILSACATLTLTFEQPSWRNMEKLRRSNCTTCKESLVMNVQEVLPRLTLIKQRILNAIGRNPVSQNDLSNDVDNIETRHAPDVPDQPITPKPQRRIGYRLNEIISYSKPANSDHEGNVLEFSLQRSKQSENAEALGASLLLYVDRRRKIRKGGKGKKIVLKVSQFNRNNSTWQNLAVLRTRVKKRRWKRISLPVKAAQQLLDSEQGSLDLKISCIGCGRLVDLVLNKNANNDISTLGADKDGLGINKLRSGKSYRKRRHKRRKHEKLLKRRQKNSGTPILVISTRVEV